MTRSDRVLEARRMMKAGEFDRAVTSIEAHDLNWDKLVLVCRHWTLWNGELCGDPTPPVKVECEECAKAWLKASDGQER